MKKFIILMLVIVLLWSCATLCGLISTPAQAGSTTSTPFQPEFPTFGPAIEWPNSLDQAWQFIEEGRNGYAFTACLPGEPTQPFITWQMANDAVGAQTESRKHPYLEIWADDVARIVAPGGGIFPTEHRIIRVHEDAVFVELIKITIGGGWRACGDEDAKPILFGPGVQEFLDWLAGGIIPGAEVEYFPIYGTTEAEWRASSVMAAAEIGGPENALAWTNWGAYASWECAGGLVANIAVDMPVQVMLPQPVDVAVFDTPEWKIYFAGLVAHEAGHVRIVREHEVDFLGINGTPCDEAPSRVDRIYGFIGLLNRQYDGEV